MGGTGLQPFIPQGPPSAFTTGGTQSNVTITTSTIRIKPKILFTVESPFPETRTVIMCVKKRRRASYQSFCSSYGNWNKCVMALFSAFDDLFARTLSCLPGLLSKLDYLSGLRHQDTGLYSHWGLARVYGDTAAQEAMSEAHALLVTEILQTPLRKLMEDATNCCADQGEQRAVFLEELIQRSSVLLPEQVGGGSSRHFSSVLHALSALAQSQQRATRRDA